VTTDDRILVLMPTAKDGERMGRVLADAGLGCAVCKDLAELCREICLGAGAAMLTEEAVGGDHDGCLAEVLRDQPPWSDFPLVVRAREGGSRGHLIRESMNATLVERPVKVRSLLSVVRAALRSRRHQYEVRDHLEERLRAADTLRGSEERYRALVEATSQAVWSWSPDGANGDFERTQQWWEEVTGQTPEQQRGSHTAWLDVVHPEDREAAGAEWRTALATGVPYDVGYRVRARDGGWRHI
jgi:PAS domain S-box-containing protein